MAASLSAWNDGPAQAAIADFVARVSTEGGPEFVPPAERIAVFDNDGTLWCEKPMPIELGFILKRLATMAEQDSALRERQPWKAACEKDFAWLGDVVTTHYHGDDSGVKVLFGGILKTFEGMPIETYCHEAGQYLNQAKHPTLARTMSACAYRPMVELRLRVAFVVHWFCRYPAAGSLKSIGPSRNRHHPGTKAEGTRELGVFQYPCRE